MKKIIFFAAMLLLQSGTIYADQLGHAGGVENDGEVPVRVKYTYKDGAYEWQDLARDSFYPFPENISSIVVSRGVNSYYDTLSAERRMRVIVTHPDGSQQKIVRENEPIQIRDDWQRRDAKKTPMFKIENRP